MHDLKTAPIFATSGALRPSDIEATARKILDKVFLFRRLLPDSEADARTDNPLRYAPHLERLRGLIQRNQPVHFVLPAFPAKSPNRAKTLGQIPDMGERLSLEFLERLCDEIEFDYPGGAYITICSDGRVFSDLVGVSDDDVSRYRDGLRRIFQTIGAVHLRLFNLEDVYDTKHYDVMREELLIGYARSVCAIREESLTSPIARALFNGIHRFMFEDLQEARPELSRNLGVVALDDGRTVRCRLLVDASGRQNSIVTKKSRQHLSQYKNVAIWNHFLGGKPAQSIDAPWNIFHKPNFSPVACFALDHGWVWYIPVPKVLNGERVLAYSIGLVTSPAILNDPSNNFLDSDRFLEELRKVDMLRELLADVKKPFRDEMLVIANYSMINEHFCDFDEKWMLIGDAAYFVDPLFSSGATFAAGMAATADLVIRSTLEGKRQEPELRGIWHDFDNEWQQIAHSFALSIDQWYHAIAKSNPGSPYWTIRSNSASDLDIREETFQA